eukprot:14741036-Ditylum_brightwellii.AAC.1
MQECHQKLLYNIMRHRPVHYIAQLMSRPTTTILIASDGSALEQENTVSFGWIKHVKSHQDDKCNFEQLDLPAQLNVRADNLATNYREKYSEPQ